MEKLILLLLSVDSIRLHSQDSLYVFGTDEYRQEFPNLETQVFYDETFALSFKFNAFRALLCVYDYQVDVKSANISCFDSKPHYDIKKESFLFSGNFLLSEKDFECLSSCLPDWTPFIERIQRTHGKLNLFPRLQVLVSDFFKSHESQIKHELDVINNEMF